MRVIAKDVVLLWLQVGCLDQLNREVVPDKSETDIG
jgi:hypothetical protein